MKSPLLGAGHAPGVEAQLHHLSWTDPDCTGKSEAPEHSQHVGDIIVWENRAQEGFDKGEKITQTLLKVGFAIKQGMVKGSHCRFLEDAHP